MRALRGRRVQHDGERAELQPLADMFRWAVCWRSGQRNQQQGLQRVRERDLQHGEQRLELCSVADVFGGTVCEPGGDGDTEPPVHSVCER